jgi:hypothetical protein
MTAHQYSPPDAAALLTVLNQATELCRRLDLLNDADTFEHLTARVQQESPIPEASRDEISRAINGIAGLRIINKLGDDFSEYRRLSLAFSRVLFPEIHEAEKQPRRPLEERIDKHCEEIMASPRKAEAREWLKQRAHCFFKTDRRYVAVLVEQFYNAGAKEVLIGDIEEDQTAQLGQSLLIVLPEDASARAKLFKIGSHAEDAFQCDHVTDKGQKFLYYSLD